MRRHTPHCLAASMAGAKLRPLAVALPPPCQVKSAHDRDGAGALTGIANESGVKWNETVMKRMLRPGVLVAVGCLAVLGALIVVGIGTEAYAETLIGVLISAAVAVTLWNRRLLRATNRETRDRAKSNQRDVARSLRVMAENQAKLSAEVARFARMVSDDKARTAETAARFDWLARRYRIQEQQLSEFLEKLAEKTDTDHEAFRRLVAEEIGGRLSALADAKEQQEQTSMLRQVRAHGRSLGGKKAFLADVSALLAVYSDVEGRAIPLGDWSLAPRVLERLHKEIADGRPRTIVELGSGASTPFLGLWASEYAGATVVSVEHDEHFLGKTSADIEFVGCGSVVELIHSPLTSVTIDGRHFEWYRDIPVDGSIDLLIVDGPPNKVAEEARFPAVPLLAERLRVGTRVVLDDVNRPAEGAILEQWIERAWFGRRLEVVDTVDTAAILEVVSIDADDRAGLGGA